MSTQAERVSDVEFVFTELARMTTSDIMAMSRRDLLNMLPHPNGRGSQVCSAAAWERIYSLAEQAGQAAKLNGRVELRALADPLAKMLVQRFQRDNEPITGKAVDRVMAAAAREARKKCSDIIHYIPCHLMWAEEPSEISFGPVTFLSRADFRQRITASARAFRTEDSRARRAQHRQLLSGALQYYRSFKWVAEVVIANCDNSTSKVIAERSVMSALDCLHLLLGPGYTEKMRIGGPRIKRDERAHLRVLASGKLDPSISLGGPGQVGFPKGWSVILDRPDYKDCRSLIAIALEAAVEPHISRPLSSRFLDAASWFGEAVRETSPAARVVKFVTAIERMVMTEKGDDIATRVAERVSALCYDRERPANRAEIMAEAARAYDLRSKLVHGSISPHEQAVSNGVRLSARLAHLTILSALMSFEEPGLRDPNASSKRLARHYDSIVALAESRVRGSLVDETP